MKRAIVGVSLLALLTLSGCKSWIHRKDECLTHQPYEDAASVAVIHGTQDIPAPSAKQALKIPDVAAPSGVKLKCLDTPPSFKDVPKQGPTVAGPKANERFHEPVNDSKSNKKTANSSDNQ